ncbi:Hsp20/alpha crystallin family protein [Flavobacteriaceae bacterium]|jgi:HSP20 family protein|nr:Hsp20/alpha crystallin family protein [Flavobacteriaceae bacterium]
MNLIRKQAPFLPSLIDDFINQDWNLKTPSSTTLPAVNIKDLDAQFEIELAVPGMKKSDFEIEVEDGLLSISSSLEEEQVTEKGKFTRREFSYNSFKRTFAIPESVDPSNIEAQYSDGVLQLRLPKRKEALPQPKKLIKIR